MRYLSLFSGIEAASVAWAGTAMEPVAFAEIEPFPSAVLEQYGKIDLVVGGSPCQSLSCAGNQDGLGGNADDYERNGPTTRSSLFFGLSSR